MLRDPKLKLFYELVNSCSKEELTWMSGYLAGVTAYAQQTQGQPSFQPDVAILQALQNASGSQVIGTGSSTQTALQPQATAVATAPSVQKITIAYGTETGNSKKLATDFAMKAKRVVLLRKW